MLFRSSVSNVTGTLLSQFQRLIHHCLSEDDSERQMDVTDQIRQQISALFSKHGESDTTAAVSQNQWCAAQQVMSLGIRVGWSSEGGRECS